MLSKVSLSSFVNDYAKEKKRVMNKDENKTYYTDWLGLLPRVLPAPR
jgi:hypothetical protein